LRPFLEGEDIFTEDVLGDSRTGLIIGGFVDVPVNNLFSVTIEGLYNQKGATGTFSAEGITIDSSVKVDYFEIPILAKFPINTMSNVRPFVYGGIAPAFRTGGKFRSEVTGAFEDVEEDNDLDDDLESMDVSFVFGGGVQFGRIGIEARYNLGLMEINKPNDEEVGSIKTRQFAILASFSFPLR
jgi:Outer membrane protein beta-barrel domain